MDLSQIDDIKELKAMAFDQLSLQDQVQRNLQAITARIAQLSQAENATAQSGRKHAKSDG